MNGYQNGYQTKEYKGKRNFSSAFNTPWEKERTQESPADGMNSIVGWKKLIGELYVGLIEAGLSAETLKGKSHVT